MADIRTTWVGTEGAWTVEGPDLAADDGLQTAVILSLFTDALATPLEAASAGVTDRRGWWGDAYPAVAGDTIGSRLWLLTREKRIAQTIERARVYARDSLQWLVDDGVVQSVEVEAEAQGTDRLALAIAITRRAQPVSRYRFEAFWRN